MQGRAGCTLFDNMIIIHDFSTSFGHANVFACRPKTHLAFYTSPMISSFNLSEIIDENETGLVAYA